jgi:hypothetical protein
METLAHSNDNNADNGREQAPLIQQEETTDEEVSPDETSQPRVEMTMAMSDSNESRGGNNANRGNFTTFRRTRRSKARWFGLAAVCLVMTGEYYA